MAQKFSKRERLRPAPEQIYISNFSVKYTKPSLKLQLLRVNRRVFPTSLVFQIHPTSFLGSQLQSSTCEKFFPSFPRQRHVETCGNYKQNSAGPADFYLFFGMPTMIQHKNGPEITHQTKQNPLFENRFKKKQTWLPHRDMAGKCCFRGTAGPSVQKAAVTYGCGGIS